MPATRAQRLLQTVLPYAGLCMAWLRSHRRSTPPSTARAT